MMIPAFYKQKGHPIVFEKVFGINNGGYEVIVIDDLSNDDTQI